MKLGRHFERHMALIYRTIGKPAHWKGALSSIGEDVGAQSGMVSIEHHASRRLLVRVDLSERHRSPSSNGAIANSHEIGALGTNHPIGTTRANELSTTALSSGGHQAGHHRPAPKAANNPAWEHRFDHEGLAIRMAFDPYEAPGYFPPPTITYLNRLAPHFQRAAELGHELSELLVSNDLLKSDIGNDGLLLVDDQLHIAAASPRAKVWLEKQLLPLRENFGRLECLDPSLAWRFRQLLEAARRSAYQQAPETPLQFELTTRQGSVRISASPYQNEDRHRVSLSRNSLVLVRISPVTKPASQRLIEQSHSWGLTTCESAVLGLIAEGQGAAEIAAARSRSIETVRSQIKCVLKKAGCRGIPELLIVVHSNGHKLKLMQR